ncbi:hypothetical protein [Pectobacterium versatile]|uniref:hypothetical protein n=1 Tax=Pectobacterium versatile TaxID=2488639 RepID=UPI00208FEDC1|nr:hypothetical protein [Pectobacterium versatile]MCO4311859.1 hypothetical protein [Pectobacterium versatile]
MNYYIDENGTTGDLFSKKFDLSFSRQPIFTHACIGIEKNQDDTVKSLIKTVKEKHDLKNYLITKNRLKNNKLDFELKCDELYFEKPEAILDIAKFIKSQRIPLICEVMDKKYNIAISIVNHIIVPHTEFIITSPEGISYRNKLADLLTFYAEDLCYKQFHALCSNPTESNLLKTFAVFFDFFKRRKSLLNDNGRILQFIEERKKSYFYLKGKIGDSCISRFHPIPDTDTFNNTVKFLPNVHSFYYMLARINKYHLGDIDDVFYIMTYKKNTQKH